MVDEFERILKSEIKKYSTEQTVESKKEKIEFITQHHFMKHKNVKKELKNEHQLQI